MSYGTRRGPATNARLPYGAVRRRSGQTPEVVGEGEFKLGEEIRSLTQVKNDGVYLHIDIGEVLVRKGDAGVVRERCSFLGEIYYTVEFVARATVVIMRGRKMARAAQ